MNTQKFVESSEAIKLFIEAGLSEGTFYRRVREGAIQKELPPGRKRKALYSLEQIERIIKQEHTHTTNEPEKIYRGKTDWVHSSDLPYLLALDYEMYGPDNTVDISITHAWWEKNPYMCRILFDAENRKDVWGAITIMPMKEETIFHLLRQEREERSITPDDILTYEPGKTYSVYISSATVRPEHRAHFRELVQSVFTYWCEQYPAIQFTNLYAYAASDEGWDLIRHLFFSPRYDLGNDAFELNPYLRNPSRLIQSFQACLHKKEGQRSTKLSFLNTKEASTFTRATPHDMPICVELSRKTFPDLYQGIATAETRIAWLEKNPDICYICRYQGRIVGYTTILPLKKQKIEKILSNKEFVRNIKPEEIQPFDKNTPVDIYIMTMVTDQSLSKTEKRTYGSSIVRGLERVISELGQRGVPIRKFFARSDTIDGVRILKKQGFTEIPSTTTQRNFVIDVEESGIPFIQKYMEVLAEQNIQKHTAITSQ